MACALTVFRSGELHFGCMQTLVCCSLQILLLDELTTFLDDEGQKSVMKAVRTAVEGANRVTAIWVTHRLEELKWADAASFIDEGQVNTRQSLPPF